MKKLTLLTAGILVLGFGTAQAEPAKYTQEEIKQMPRLSSIEQVRCPSAKFTSNKKRLECKEKVQQKMKPQMPPIIMVVMVMHINGMRE